MKSKEYRVGDLRIQGTRFAWHDKESASYGRNFAPVQEVRNFLCGMDPKYAQTAMLLLKRLGARPGHVKRLAELIDIVRSMMREASRAVRPASPRHERLQREWLAKVFHGMAAARIAPQAATC